ncbi:unnamed protein product, partial [Gordionus sp. m RMFG-2023]
LFNISHPWDTVTKAAWRKYPNPMNTSVHSIDVINRSVDAHSGALITHRLIQTSWRIPAWIQKFININPDCYVSEISQLDPNKKIMTSQSTNLSMVQNIAIEERLIYSQHPRDINKTHMINESTITIKGVPLSNYLEKIIENTMVSKSNSGKLAMEWVIEKINNEVKEISKNSTFNHSNDNYL